MNSLLCILFSAGIMLTSCFGLSNQSAKNTENLTEGCKSAYLIDFYSGECIYKDNELKRMPIASVCKVMTLTLIFDALQSGKISTEQCVVASENASGMGGSQVFLGKGCEYTVDQLIKSIVVCSANDSCVAMSEAISGSEEQFVSMMNNKAKELDCNNTLFSNCTGLPKPTQYSCARDVAIMFRNLLSYDKYFDYSRVWLEDFVHPDNRTISMTNTNKLLKRYTFCDGGKTGFTNEAGFCFAATAKQDNLRFVAAILGADSSDIRFNSTINLFNYGFSNYKNKIVLDKDVMLNDNFNVEGGKKDNLAVCPERNCYVFSSIASSPDINFSIEAQAIKAPIVKGQVVGKIEIYKNGIIYDTVNVVAAEDIEKAGYKDYFKNVTERWAI